MSIDSTKLSSRTPCTSELAALELIEHIVDIGDAHGISAGKGLAIVMHDTGGRPTLSEALLRFALDRNADRLVIRGTQETIHQQLSSLLLAGKRFDRVCSAFEMHHMTDLRSAMERVRELLTDSGILYCADYTFAEANIHDPDEVVGSAAENVQISRYGGFNAWLQAHSGLSLASMEESMEQAGYPSVTGHRLPGRRGLVVGYNRFVYGKG